MYQSSTGLPHLLAPKAYFDPEFYRSELSTILNPSWQLVGTTLKLQNSGDFFTTSCFGEEIQVRNFDGCLKALSNVCAHRHCLISDQAQGHSPAMRCQYHGWEYGEDGFTRKIPCAKEFAPIDRSSFRLHEYRIETAGQLVFICLDQSAGDLQTFLGPIASRVMQRFGADWRQFYRGKFQYEANWKVSIENSLEAYHVESIHPNTFRAAPGEDRSEHLLNSRHTSFSTDTPFAAHHRSDEWFQRIEGWMVRKLGVIPTCRYEQHHVFPNLLFSFTDAISLVHSVVPLGPTSSRSLMFQFGLFPAKISFGKRMIARLLGRVEAEILKRIMKEDMQLYPSIQRGLQSSRHQGTLARSEERIHAFQDYHCKLLSNRTSESMAATDSSEGKL